MTLTKNLLLNVSYVQNIMGHTKIRSRVTFLGSSNSRKIDLDSTGGITIKKEA